MFYKREGHPIWLDPIEFKHFQILYTFKTEGMDGFTMMLGASTLFLGDIWENKIMFQ